MPNHVINEVIFRGVDADRQLTLLDKVLNAKGEIDFSVLLPVPLNAWMGSVGARHEKAFRLTALDWARDNWGTKRNAYGLDQGGKYQSVAKGDDTLTLTFQTAYRPPYGWLVAIFNHFQQSFDHRWLDEGAAQGVVGKFDYAVLASDRFGQEPWQEEPADNGMQRHLHKLLWGVEEFPDEPDEDAA